MTDKERTLLILVEAGDRQLHIDDGIPLAKDLYKGKRYGASERLAEQEGARTFRHAHTTTWAILSPLHHVLSPESACPPYNHPWSKSDDATRLHARWAAQCVAEMCDYMQGPILNPTEDVEVLVLLGRPRYRQALVGMLTAAGFTVHNPFLGKDEAEMLKWLEQRTGVPATS